MNPRNVFQLELAAALCRRRALLLRLGVTVLLSLPFVLAAMPVRLKACGLVTVVVFTGVLGSAVGMARRRGFGKLARPDAPPLRRWVVMLDLLLAGAAVWLVPSGLITVLFVLVNSQATAPAAWAVLAGLLCGALVGLSLLGMFVAAATSNNAQVCLLGALAAGLVAFLSGLFPVPAPLGGGVTAAATWSPVGGLARCLQALGEGADPPAPAHGLGGLAITATLGAAILARCLAGKLKR